VASQWDHGILLCSLRWLIASETVCPDCAIALRSRPLWSPYRSASLDQNSAAVGTRSISSLSTSKQSPARAFLNA
jgi:hypothetical protein